MQIQQQCKQEDQQQGLKIKESYYECINDHINFEIYRSFIGCISLMLSLINMNWSKNKLFRDITSLLTIHIISCSAVRPQGGRLFDGGT